MLLEFWIKSAYLLEHFKVLLSLLFTGVKKVWNKEDETSSVGVNAWFLVIVVAFELLDLFWRSIFSEKSFSKDREIVRCSSSLVRNSIWAWSSSWCKSFYCWVSLDSILSTNWLVLSAVYLSPLYILWSSRRRFPLWLEIFAMTTPWSIEFNHPNTVRIKHLRRKVGIC